MLKGGGRTTVAEGLQTPATLQSNNRDKLETVFANPAELFNLLLQDCHREPSESLTEMFGYDALCRIQNLRDFGLDDVED
jgi:hypothetical protein